MTALLGRDVGPEQIDQLVTRDGTRPSLEMQVEQDGQVLPSPEADGRAPLANQLRGSEDLELKRVETLMRWSGHVVPRSKYPRGCGVVRGALEGGDAR